MVRKIRVSLIACLLALGGLLPIQPALAGGCPAPCLGLGIQDDLNVFLSPQTDSVSGSQAVDGNRSWDFQIQNQGPITQTALNASISVNTGYPASDFPGESRFPVTTSTPVLTNANLSLSIFSTIPVTFAPGVDSSRSVSPLMIPPGGGQQTETVAATLIDTSLCSPNGIGQTVCGHLCLDMEAGAVRSGSGTFVAFNWPPNVSPDQKNGGATGGSGVNWCVVDATPGTQYVFTLVLDLPALGRPYAYKPSLGVAYSNSGPGGCIVDSCTGPQSSVVIADPTLDGPTANAGQLTFSAYPGFVWDEGGPPFTRVVHYAQMFCPPGSNSERSRDAGGGRCR